MAKQTPDRDSLGASRRSLSRAAPAAGEAGDSGLRSGACGRTCPGGLGSCGLGLPASAVAQHGVERAAARLLPFAFGAWFVAPALGREPVEPAGNELRVFAANVFAANVFAVAVRASDDLFRRRSAGHQDAVELLAAFFFVLAPARERCPELLKVTGRSGPPPPSPG